MSSQREIVLRHGVYGKQLAFLNSNSKYRVFVAGIGSGKTTVGVLEVLRMPPTSRGMIVAPTYQMLRDATLNSFMEAGGKDLIARFNQQTGEMTLKSGTEILWRSADNFEALRGPNLGWVYIDEAALVKESAYDVLLGRLREPPAKLWMTTTPRGYDWIYRLWVKEHGTDPDYFLVRASTRDNPFLPDGYVESLQAKYGGGFAMQEIEGEFCEWGKAPVYEFRRERNTQAGLFEKYQRDKPLILTCDFNFQIKPWAVAQVIDGKPCILKEVVVRQGTIKDCVEQFRDYFPAQSAELEIHGDSSGRARSAQTARSDYQLVVEAFKGYSAPIRLCVAAANPHVRDRINNHNRILRGEDNVGPLKLDPDHCQHLIEDHLNTEWHPNGRDILKVSDPNDPASEWTHGTDAIGYWLWRRYPMTMPIATLATMKKKSKPLVYRRVAGDAW